MKVSHDVHMVLAPDVSAMDGDRSDVYEFVIGGWGNTQSVIRRGIMKKTLAKAKVKLYVQTNLRQQLKSLMA